MGTCEKLLNNKYRPSSFFEGYIYDIPVIPEEIQHKYKSISLLEYTKDIKDIKDIEDTKNIKICRQIKHSDNISRVNT